jgi:putative phage-type endonuclease
MQIIEQRSDDWFKIRRGKITSSEIHKIMGKADLSDTAKTYLLERVAELYGAASVTPGNAATEWGVQWEPVAVDYYSEQRKVAVEAASFIVHSDYYGGSPDGIVNPDGIIEVKCPHNSANHFKHGLIKSDEDFKKKKPDYYYQCISNMICANAQWCDFISFDPRVNEKYTMFVYRLHRNEDEVVNILSRLDVAVEQLKTYQSDIENSKQLLLEVDPG